MHEAELQNIQITDSKEGETLQIYKHLFFRTKQAESESTRQYQTSQNYRQDTIERVSNMHERRSKATIERSDQKKNNMDLINELKQTKSVTNQSRDLATKRAATQKEKVAKSSENLHSEAPQILIDQNLNVEQLPGSDIMPKGPKRHNKQTEMRQQATERSSKRIVLMKS